MSEEQKLSDEAFHDGFVHEEIVRYVRSELERRERWLGYATIDERNRGELERQAEAWRRALNRLTS
jgi:hypothetical protein